MVSGYYACTIHEFRVDIELITDLRTMSHVWAGDMNLRMAKDAGRLELKGNPTLIRTISSCLRPERSLTSGHSPAQSASSNLAHESGTERTGMAAT